MSAFNIPFPHRVSASPDGKFYNVEDALIPAHERALALADLLDMVLEIGDLDGLGENSLRRVAEAIRMEIMDAQAIVKAYMAISERAATDSENQQA